MHECDIVHRDIKPENILINGKGVLKITDFGVADYGHTIAGDFTSSVKQSDAVVGSPPYAPPEVSQLSGTQHSQRTSYDPFKMDIWALGMISRKDPEWNTNLPRASQIQMLVELHGDYVIQIP
ncbi:unnamed protein product [[Candida] boidinii]|nr:unnamed protein product [[Candida] boidinii]